jgi:hypothetical protein
MVVNCNWMVLFLDVKTIFTNHYSLFYLNHITMTLKYYQFDYAEMSGFEIKSMGVLNIQVSTQITKDILKDLARKHLQLPDAHIVISNVAKLTKNEFETIPGHKVY